jgi:hypothetical protein
MQEVKSLLCQYVDLFLLSAEWLLLVPLSRKTELYHAVAYGHSNKEHVFRHARERYGAVGNDFAGRLRRAGIPAQTLRVHAAMLLDWFRFNLRYGFLDSLGLPVEVNVPSLVRLSGIQDRSTGAILEPGVGTQRLGRVVEEREREGLYLPYGPAWTSAIAGTTA